MEEHKELTFGQKAVGITFNPSKDPLVDEIKQEFADIIDVLNDLRGAAINSKDGNSEIARLASVAITEAQTAQMWAIKAVTWGL